MKRGYAIIASTAVLLAVIGGFGFAMRGSVRDFLYEARKPQVPAAVPVDVATAPVTNVNAAKPANANVNAPTPAPIPAAYNLAVPFAIQAPFANWTGSYEDGCEEASALMVHYYYTKQLFENQDEVKEELDRTFVWQDRVIGYNYDTTAEETARMLREYFGYKKVEVTTDVTAARIKKEIASGRPVIVPAYGKALLNPNFRNGGPDYHMLVIKGYTKDTFVSNDPGTRRGADYVYPATRLLDAVHDWNDGDVEHGKKVMIIVHPNR